MLDHGLRTKVNRFQENAMRIGLLEMLSSHTAAAGVQFGLGRSPESFPAPTMSFLHTVPEENTMVIDNGLGFNFCSLQGGMQDESPKTSSAHSEESDA